MPFVSAAQRGYFNANRAKLEAQGVNVDEWNKASKGMSLPYRSASSQRVQHGLHKVDQGRKKKNQFGPYGIST